MAEIRHLFHISVPRTKVYEAVSSIDGLSKWWTKQTTGSSDVGGNMEFRFGPVFFNAFKVLEAKSSSHVKWECTDGPPDWIGTHVTFTLDENEGKTRVRFSHDGFKEVNDFFGQCNFSWGRYMESLRNLCEKGQGSPFVSPQPA
jgi:uncharacterized protein YndB with AHSA1/START domain